MKFLKLSNSPKHALVDDEDLDKCKLFTWRIVGDGKSSSIHTSIGLCAVSLTNFVMNTTNILYDHKNRDPFDNQKLNIRKCTPTLNNANQIKHKGNYSSIYKGVYRFKRDNNWAAQIAVNHHKMHLGYFSTETEAAKAYNNAAKKHFGEFAYLNEFEKEIK